MDFTTVNQTIGDMTAALPAVDGQLAHVLDDISTYGWNGSSWIEVVGPELASEKSIRDFVKRLPMAVRKQMMSDYDDLEHDRLEKESVLHKIVQEWSSILGTGPVANISDKAKDLMFEVYKIQSEAVLIEL